MKSRPREPEILYRDNYDPFKYERDENSIEREERSYQSKYAQSKFA